MEKVGRNNLCPCGSGKKYKHCCLEREKDFSVIAKNTPPVIDYYQVFDGKKWHKKPGRVIGKIVVQSQDTVVSEIENVFKVTSTLPNGAGITKALYECKKKLYFLEHRLRCVEKLIAEEVEKLRGDYQAGSGMAIERALPSLEAEVEAFLTQAKSSLDYQTHVFKEVFPTWEKKVDTFDEKCANELARVGEGELGNLIRLHMAEWLEEMRLWRNNVVHRSSLAGYKAFVEQPYLGDPTVNVSYPAMPSGNRVDLYCKDVYANVLKIYGDVLKKLAHTSDE